MAVKSQTKYSERTRHQVNNKSVVFETDLTTMEQLTSPIGSDVPVYNGTNLVVSKTIDGGVKRNYRTQEWVDNKLNGSLWTGEVLAELGPVDENSSADTQILKKDYTKLQQFAYYGSCVELFRASLNNIITKFPGEIYVDYYIDVDGSKVRHSITKSDGTEYSALGSDGRVHNAYCLNPFAVNIYEEVLTSEMTGKTLGHFANGGYLNYEVVTRNGKSWKIAYWKIENRSDKQCFLPGDLICNVVIGSSSSPLGISTMAVGDDFEVGLDRGDEGLMYLSIIKTENGVGVFTSDYYLGYHIRPQKSFIDVFYSELTAFERQLLNRYSTPLYKTIFEVVEETDRGIEKRLESFIFPVDDGGYNIDVFSNAYYSYVQRLSTIGQNYDDLYSDNLVRMMAHTSVKVMDWSLNKDTESNEYTDNANKLKKVLRVVGRCFDETKSYIDGIENVHTVSYSDKTGTSNYNLSDELELEGWDVVSVVPIKQRGYYEHSGDTAYTVTTMPIADPAYLGDIVIYGGSDYGPFHQFNYYRCERRTAEMQVYNTGSRSLTIDSDTAIFHVHETCLRPLSRTWASLAPLTVSWNASRGRAGEWCLYDKNGVIVKSYTNLDRFGFGVTSRETSGNLSDYSLTVTDIVWFEDKPIEAGTKIYTTSEPADKCTNIIIDEKNQRHEFYREFFEDETGQYQPYAGDEDGVFIKCCGEEEPAKGKNVTTEEVKFVVYKGKKYYLNCNGKLLEKTDSGIVEHPIRQDGHILLRGMLLPVQTEFRLLNRVAAYASNNVLTSKDINYEFQKRLKLCSKSILRKKGTIAGLEELLGMFGLKSERFVSLSNNLQLRSDYSIKEASMYTKPLIDEYSLEHRMPLMDWYNTIKTYHYNYGNAKYGIYDSYRGLPVKGVSYYSVYNPEIADWEYTTNEYDWLGNSMIVDHRKVYPFFDDTAKYDGDMYYQMYGGWLKKLPYVFGKKNMLICGETYTETLRNIHAVDTIPDLSELPEASLNDEYICEVISDDTKYMIVNGKLYPIKTESKRLINSSEFGPERMNISYIEIDTYDNGFYIGNVAYDGIIAVSDPCYTMFERRFDLADQIGMRKQKVYLYRYEGEKKIPVDINHIDDVDTSGTTSGVTYGQVTLDIAAVYSDAYGEMYSNQAESCLVNVSGDYSSYWILDTPGNVGFYAMDNSSVYTYGWKNLKKNDARVVLYDSVQTIKKGNNPHSALVPYDDGAEYLRRFVNLFKVAYENDDFDTRCFEDVEEAFDDILGYGFENIFVDKYSTYINPNPITEATLARMEIISSFDVGKLVKYVGADTEDYEYGHYYRGVAVLGEDGETVSYEWVDEPQEKVYINGLYDTKAHAFCNRKAADGTVYKYGTTGNKIFDIWANSTFHFPRLGEDDDDSNPDRIINTKYVDIKFFTNSSNVELVKYLDVAIVSYLQQILPSTLIASINYGDDGDCGIGCMIVEDNFIVR